MPSPQRVLIGNERLAYDVRDRVPDAPGGFEVRDAGQVEHLTIHHDAAHFRGRSRTISVELRRLELVFRFHRINNGWPGISYHFYVFPSGRIYYTGDWATIRYQAAGEDNPNTPLVISAHNEHGIGICLAGNFQALPPTAKQLQATARLVANLRFLFSNADLPVLGHRDEADAPQYATACPGNTWEQWKDAVS